MRRIWLSAVLVAVGLASSAVFAFEEQKMRPAQPQAAETGSGKPGVALSDPGVAVPRVDTGTKIRVPGLGVIGEIPKMDFGLELLYGASQPKGPEADRTDANGVMGRVTVPIRPSR